MIHIIELPISILPIDCYDLNLHIKNVMDGLVDESNQTELFIKNYLCRKMATYIEIPWVTFRGISYRISDSKIYFTWRIDDDSTC